MKRQIWLKHSKSHFQCRKCQVWLIFTYLSILISGIGVLPKCIASWSYCCSQILMALVYLKGYLQCQKGLIWTLVIYLGQYIRNGAWYDQCLYVAHIQSHIWSFSLCYDPWPWITLKGRIKVTDDQSLYEIHIISCIWILSLPYNINLTFDAIEGQVKVIKFSLGYISWIKPIMTKVYLKHIYEVMHDLSVYLNTFDLVWHLEVKSRSHNFQMEHLWPNLAYNACRLWTEFISNAHV